MSLLSRPPLASRICFTGLLVGIVGLLVQWAADPAKFGTFPPGILFVGACGLLMIVTGRWWWHPTFAVVAGAWIVGAGSLADELQPNLVSSNPGTVAGNAIMAIGLVVAAIVGLIAMIRSRRTRKTTGTARLAS